MAVIGSARVDEAGKYSGGKRGDQKQTAAPDYKGEVSRQQFYVHKKGWTVLRPIDPVHARAIAQAMAMACDNPNIGYSQSDRYSILSAGTCTAQPVNCDCSSLVRQCVKEGTGRDPGDFTTANEATRLVATGLFTRLDYAPGMALQAGDLIVTRTKGHTCIVIEGDVKKTPEEIALEVLDGKWGTGMDRKNRLNAAGYDYAEVQAIVNALVGKPAQHVNQAGIDLIKSFEGVRLKAYQLAGETYYTIGYGHHGPDVLPNMTISQERAEELLRIDLVRFENYVKKYVTDITLTQNRLNALTSYCYNRGPKGMKQLADNCHTVQEYADGIVIYWGSAKRYKDALLRRRRAEQAVFLKG
jgi:GH24 family phage-related lysozyme (muramidase)